MNVVFTKLSTKIYKINFIHIRAIILTEQKRNTQSHNGLFTHASCLTTDLYKTELKYNVNKLHGDKHEQLQQL